MALDRYRDVLRVPGVRRLLVTSLVARAPNGMSSLAILLLVARAHGYGRAGLVTGTYVAAAAVTNPWVARLVDRLGARPVLVGTAACYAAAMSALASVPAGAYPLTLLTAALAGISGPPVVPVVRGLWPRKFEGPEVQAAYGLEATAQELIFIVGPALVAVVAGLSQPRVAVLVTAALAFGGTVALATAPEFRDRPPREAVVRHRLLRRTRLPVYVGIGVTLCIGFTMSDVAIVAFVSGRSASPQSGAVLAVWSVGSMLGGLLFGAAKGRVDEATVGAGTLAVAAGLAACALAPGAVGLAAILFTGGMVVAPVLARLYAQVGATMPDGAATEAFAWVGVGLLVGSSIGASVGGLTVESLGPRVTFLLAATLPAAAAVALLVHHSARIRLRRTDPLPS